VRWSCPLPHTHTHINTHRCGNKHSHAECAVYSNIAFISFFRSFVCFLKKATCLLTCCSCCPKSLNIIYSRFNTSWTFELNQQNKTQKAIPYHYYESHRQAENMWQNNNLSVIPKTEKQKARKQTKWIPCTALTFKRESMPFIIIIMIIIIKL